MSVRERERERERESVCVCVYFTVSIAMTFGYDSGISLIFCHSDACMFILLFFFSCSLIIPFVMVVVFRISLRIRMRSRAMKVMKKHTSRCGMTPTSPPQGLPQLSCASTPLLSSTSSKSWAKAALEKWVNHLKFVLRVIFVLFMVVLMAVHCMCVCVCVRARM